MASTVQAVSRMAFLWLSWSLTAESHGTLLDPPSRNIQAGPKNGYCPHCGNGNGICGDGNQWPSDSDYLNFYDGPKKTWNAGSIEKVVVTITAHHKGHFEMSICDQVLDDSVRNPQDCLDKWILERASPEEAGFRDCQANDKRGGCQPLDPRHKERFYLPPSSFTPDESNTFTFYVKVPAAVRCQGRGCTLQWRWWSANSCIPAKDYGCFTSVLSAKGYSPSDWGVRGSCPGGSCTRCGCGEEFRNCADITVLPSGGAGVTTPAPPRTTSATTTQRGVTTPASPRTTSATTTPECVSHEVLKCINDASSYWPKCDAGQSKNVVGPSGYEFGFYCSNVWSKALNEMLSHPAVNKCYDRDAIHKLLAQVAYETGYFSTVYQPRDGGAGMIHMIPGNWPTNARDMDTLFPGNYYELILSEMPLGKDFFQSPAYGWKSVAAWYKLTNGVIPSCGKDLFEASFQEQTRCILSRIVSRQEAYDIVASCLGDLPSVTTPEPASTTAAPASTTPGSIKTTTISTTAEAILPSSTTTPEGTQGNCVRNPDCDANAWCKDPAYDTWCPQQVKFGGPCPSPQCIRGSLRR
eukprot:TRINITY_DN564_c0_g1_i1.p1 TRINITY_DN564_c0_g1~~TRINITY_DN564_c0_g1_i1.p1  ORF type:complete len:579 (+),score=91.86 TRINITY_DN564_c0_g1_i1:72-1808(+)